MAASERDLTWFKTHVGNVCPVILAFAKGCNKWLPHDKRSCFPYMFSRFDNSKGPEGREYARTYALVDLVVHNLIPLYLRETGRPKASLPLEKLPVIVDNVSARRVTNVIWSDDLRDVAKVGDIIYDIIYTSHIIAAQDLAEEVGRIAKIAGPDLHEQVEFFAFVCLDKMLKITRP